MKWRHVTLSACQGKQAKRRSLRGLQPDGRAGMSYACNQSSIKIRGLLAKPKASSSLFQAKGSSKNNVTNDKKSYL
jgi:hypothetical protein